MAAIQCLVLVTVILTFCEAYKILVVVAIPSRSHTILGNGVARHLLDDGNEVTFISAFPHELTHPHLRMIDISANINGVPENMYSIPTIIHQQFYDYDSLFTTMIKITRMTFKNDNVLKLLNNPNEHFDAVIAEWLTTELPVGLASLYNCPMIWISSMDTHWLVLNLIDQPSNPAYTGHMMSLALPPFTFWQRAKELFSQLKVQYWKYMYLDKLEKQVYEELIAPIVKKRGRQPPSYYDIQFNASLVLANSHTSLGQAISIPHNYIPVGGYHIEDVEPLPNDLQKIMDNAKHGVIYFSLGSNLNSKEIPKVMKDGIIKTFAGLKQTVVWKYEEDLPNLPRNIHILKWAPQRSILSHSNTILFITHCGLLSMTESVHFGKPMIGIPVFADQFLNIANAIKRGFAKRVDLTNAIGGDLKSAIEDIIADPRYAEKAKEISLIYHDRPVPPGKEISHWVKHVIETRGAPHLRSPGLHVPFYQKLYLDLFFVIIVILFVFVILLKYLYSFCFLINNIYNKKNN